MLIILANTVWGAALWVWCYFVGEGYYLQDFLATILGVTIPNMWLRKYVSSGSIWRRGGVIVAAISAGLVLSWLSISAFDSIFRSREPFLGPESIPISQTRFKQISDRSRIKKRIGLSLSGGGYRAALFHAGVLSAFEDLNIPISVISSVSGGSLVGAYYVHGGKPEDIRHAIGSGRLNIGRYIATFPRPLHLVCPGTIPFLKIKLMPFCSFDRVDAQAELLNKVLFHGVSLTELPNDLRPKLVMNMTDIRNGLSVAVAQDLLLLRGKDRPFVYRFNDRVRLTENKSKSTAFFVAISGAFPGAFPSKLIPFSFQLPAYSLNPFFPSIDSLSEPSTYETEFMLSDGGIMDNSGLRTLQDLDFLAFTEDRQQCLRYPLDPITGEHPAYPPYLWFPEDHNRDQHEIVDLRKKEEARLGLRPSSYWAVDLVIGSNGSAPIRADNPDGELAQLKRAIDLASSFSRFSDLRGICEAPAVLIDPDGWSIPGYVSDPWGFAISPQSLKPIQGDNLITSLPKLGYYPFDLVLEELISTHPDHAIAKEKLLAYRGSIPLKNAMFDPSKPKAGKHKWENGFESVKEWLDNGQCNNDRFFEDFPFLREGNCEELALVILLQSSFISNLRTFRATSTLDGYIPREDSEAIFHLGKYLTYLKWPEIYTKRDLPHGAIPTGVLRAPMPIITKRSGIYTYSCNVNGEPVLIDKEGPILSEMRGLLQVGQQVESPHPNCIFGMTSAMGVYCVTKDGSVFLGSPIPVGQCQQCKKNKCN